MFSPASDTASTLSSASPTPQESVSDSAIPLGTETSVAGDRSITVSNSEQVPSISANEYLPPLEEKGGKLIVVYVTLKNTGEESGNMAFTTFELVDSQGRKYSTIEDFEEIVTITDWLSTKGLADSSDQLFPGGTAETAYVFRTAPDAEDLKLLVRDQTFAIN